MHPCLVKVKVRMRRDCRKTWVHRLRMFNHACPGSPVVGIDKMGVPLVSGGFGAADTFSGDQTDAVRQRTCQGCAFACWAFFSIVAFSSYWPPNFMEATEKSVFRGKRFLSGNFQNFATKWFTGTWIHVFLSSFADIGKVEVTKRVRDIHHEKVWNFAPCL